MASERIVRSVFEALEHTADESDLRSIAMKAALEGLSMNRATLTDTLAIAYISGVSYTDGEEDAVMYEVDETLHKMNDTRLRGGTLLDQLDHAMLPSKVAPYCRAIISVLLCDAMLGSGGSASSAEILLTLSAITNVARLFRQLPESLKPSNTTLSQVADVYVACGRMVDAQVRKKELAPECSLLALRAVDAVSDPEVFAGHQEVHLALQRSGALDGVGAFEHGKHIVALARFANRSQVTGGAGHGGVARSGMVLGCVATAAAASAASMF